MAARDTPDGSADARPLPCPPCRGTGSVQSALGGESRAVTCPWCEGSGTLTREHDAQEAGVRLRGDAAPTADPAPPADPPAA